MKAAVVALMLMTSTGRGAWTYNSGHGSLTNLGALIASCTQGGSYFLIHTNGDKHLILPYYGGTSGDLVDVNLSQGSIRKTNVLAGRFNYNTLSYSNGLCYFSVGSVFNGTHHSVFTSYDVQTGATNLIALTYEFSDYYSDFGDDGNLYLSSYGGAADGGCQLEKYNPTTGVFTQLGNVDTNHVPIGSQYGYSLGADSNYCYVAIHDDSWYLGVVNTTTLVKTNFWYPGYATSTGDIQDWVYRGKAGGWFLERIGGTASGDIALGAHVWYALSNGVPNLLLTNSSYFKTNVYYLTDQVNDAWRGGAIQGALDMPVSTDYGFDTAFIAPNSSNNWATIGYTNLGTLAYNYISVSNFNLAASVLKKFYANGSNLRIVTQDYSPLIDFNPDSKYVTIDGLFRGNPYDMLTTNGLWYVAGYDAITYVWNPALPWTLTPSSSISSPSINPHTIGTGIATHEMYPCFGSDGFLYMPSWVSRNGSGGKFIWFDLVHGTNYSYQPFASGNDAPADMVSVLGGTKFVYLSFGTPTLRIFDVATKTWPTTNSSILPNVSSLNKCVEVSPGVVVGISGSNIWKYDVTSDTVLYTNSLPGTAWSGFTYSHPANGNDQVLNLGPDGNIWVTLGSNLYRIPPATCIPELMISNVSANNVMFNQGNAFLWNQGTTLSEIPGIFTNTSTATIGTAYINTLLIGSPN